MTVVIGLVMLAGTVKNIAGQQQRLKSKMDYHSRLLFLGQECQEARVIQATYETLTPGTPVSLSRLAEGNFGTATVIHDPVSASVPLPGWKEWTTSMRVEGVSITSLTSFASQLEEQSPPWTLTRCDVSASGLSNGLVSATLELASLRRETWPGPDADSMQTETP
jgi:hypothetical protein